MVSTGSAYAKNPKGDVSAYRVPKDMYVTSRIVMTEDKINASEEYLNTAKYLHHLWQPHDDVKDVKKMILMHKDAQEQL